MFFCKAIHAFLILFVCFVLPVAAQPTDHYSFKQLNVADGLPQSFISGLVQDSTGFIWIGTRDGLARYDGRKFKLFRHFPGDTSTLANNTIASLFLDRKSRLWINYEGGDIDVLHTTTEKLFHFSWDTVFKATFAAVKPRNSMMEDAAGNICLLGRQGMFFCNLDLHRLLFRSFDQLGLRNNPVLNFAASGTNLILVTDTALVIFDAGKKIVQTIPYTFKNGHLYDPDLPFKNICFLVRASGEMVVMDNGSIFIFNPVKNGWNSLLLPAEAKKDIACAALDTLGNIFFNYNTDLYVLSPANSASLWKKNTARYIFPPKSMLLDRSGVLWVGGNASGIELFDLRLSRLTGSAYQKNFLEDVLTTTLSVPAEEIQHTFLENMQPYLFRWVKEGNGKIWLSKAGNERTIRPKVCYFTGGHLVFPAWNYTDLSVTKHSQISAMAFSASGKLWGMDYDLHPVCFDTQKNAVTVYPPVASTIEDPAYTVNCLLMEGEENLWLTTSLGGLYHHNIRTGQTIRFRQNDLPGMLPGNQLMNMVNDPVDPDYMWIGSLGSGLIKFNKKTSRCRIYTTNDGLPNNTVYAITADPNGRLWCSSNKGIFSFDPQTEKIRSFTSKDGLPCDEFNRFHFLQLPDNRLAFGGVSGYTIFDPFEVPRDLFRPATVLTGLRINNMPADKGDPGSPIAAAINSLEELVLPHNQNFLTFEFAALEYNITEKLQYQYMLQGFDDNWIYAGAENTAAYTNIPPGSYTLLINATNTAAEWSNQVKTIRIVIRPPFWKTWWFIGVCMAAAAWLIYYLISQRIAAVRKEERQKRHFEQEALELKAQALRAQMNPHFIFNCLNSIKALIQEDSKQQAVSYLTTFSKLIRNQLNSAQPQIALLEELETCKLYTELESLRFSSKIEYEFITEEGIDTRSCMVPPLILQPFIENALWHGILPKGGGKVTIAVTRNAAGLQCTIDDNGVGRETSVLNKSRNHTYQSKGMKLVQGRLHCHNMINSHEYSIDIVDKKEPDGTPAGTRVIVHFKNEV